jgi:preprotein translocase subunit SecF
MSASATKKTSWGNRLHRGEVSYDFIGNQKRWYTLSGALIVISIISLLTLGLKFSLDFTGGSQFSVKSSSMSIEQARSAVASAAPGVKDPTIIIQYGGITGRQVVVKTTTITNDVSTKIKNELGKDAGVAPDTIAVSSVSGSWGGEITNKAVTGLIIFMILVSLYLAIFYEWKMAVAGLIALVHDLVITAGIYSLVGFEVSPATVIGFLTILGYSLYDTVVVFDKVKENTTGLGTTRKDLTYTQAANLAVNQTLIRSLNTSLIALMPVAALLFAGLMTGGAGVLQDLALALLVGIAVGTYSSIFIATPLLADMKEREPDMRTLARRVGKAQAEGRTADVRGVPTQDRIPAGFTVTEVDADNPAAATTSRGPRNQPVRGDRARNRPSGKKR